ncbi:S-type anion channel SLAH1 [Euphorbia peplus]|nr:S-type anion channel SLAH1 [Euphorbia peplus]
MAESDCSKPKTDHITIEASILSSTKPSSSPPPPPSSSSSIITRLHAGHFQITLSLTSQALLWKILITIAKSDHNESKSNLWHTFHKLPTTAFHILWWISLLSQIILTFIYILKTYLHFNMVKSEFNHYIGVNILYVPWISWLILIQSSPYHLLSPTFTYLVLCWLFAFPILLLDVKLYGQWITTEKRFLSVLANPTSQISVIANLMVAKVAAENGQKESAICMFSLGMVHYLVLFVTLYQRLSGSNSFPAILRPAFFLFFAAPSLGSSAWNSISGGFDNASKMLFFLSLFLFMSLASRPAMFKKSVRRFNVAWWTYSFPLTFLALASIEYANEVRSYMASKMMLLVSAISVLVFFGSMLLTAINFHLLLHEKDPFLCLFNS